MSHHPVISQVLAAIGARIDERREALEASDPNDAGQIGQQQGAIIELKNMRVVIEETSAAWLENEDPD